MLLFLLLPHSVNAKYTDSCSHYARRLWRAADSYESAKSSFESACDPYIGYSKDDELACGAYGYEKSSYDAAKSELEDALNNVSNFCGTCDSILGTFIQAYKREVKKLESEINSLKNRIIELEMEKKALNKESKPRQ